MPFAEINDTRLYYTDSGTGEPPLLLVHGWTCDSLDWSWQLDAFARRHRVIVVDLRGHGRSDPVAGFTLALLAHDLAALVDTLRVGPVVAVGHSLGAAVVSVLAVEHPTHVQALVTIDGVLGITGDELEERMRTAAQHMLGPRPQEYVAERLAQTEGPAAADGLVAWHRQRVLGHDPQFLVNSQKALPESGLVDRSATGPFFARRACPVLAFYCDPERAQWEETTFRDADSRAYSWPGSGHWLHQERPLEFNHIVLEWISGLEKA